MRALLKAFYLALPIALVAVAAVLPLPLSWSIGGMILGLLFFQLALAGSFDGFLPNSRRYLALRAETERLLELVRELNASAVAARTMGLPEERYTEPILREMHDVVDALPRVAGRTEAAERLQRVH